jgi:hypothetical protein
VNLDDLRDSKDAAWSVAKVATLLHLDERTVRRACETGQIESIKVGVPILISTDYLRQRFCATAADISSVDPAPTGPSTNIDPREGPANDDTARQLHSA